MYILLVIINCYYLKHPLTFILVDASHEGNHFLLLVVEDGDRVGGQEWLSRGEVHHGPEGVKFLITRCILVHHQIFNWE
mgnify:CR=1 FL=1